MSIIFEKDCFHLSNARVSYIIRLAAGKYPLHLYWGKKLRGVSDTLVDRLTIYNDANFSLHEIPMDSLPQECPVFGVSDFRAGMLDIRHADGTQALDLVYEGYEIIDGKPEAEGLPGARGENAQTLILTLKDAKSGIAVALNYTVWEDVDIIARSAKIINGGSDTVIVEKALSMCVDFERADYNLLTLSGGWTRERKMFIRPLVPGNQGTDSLRTASSHQASPFLALMAPNADETHGDVYGFSLCWSGNFLANVNVDQYGMARAQMGIHPYNFDWELKSGEAFRTPEAFLCYSAEGLGGMSRNFHRLVHRHITRSAYAGTARPILINNWEATYFDFNEEKLLALAKKAKEADIDLFVLDDGWFGRRDIDNCSLGDWFDDRRKLPDGLRGLSDKIHALGLKFGLWVEPEMISPDSDLYRAHPDWCIHASDRIQVEIRHQLVLDLTRQDVKDYIVETICAALERGNVDYCKWDMNRNINMIGSEGLAPERMKELGVRYILGVYEVMDRITSRFPNVLFESCAGGGGRFDMGILCYMPQTWTSDDTDAHERCAIQYGTSLVFPPSAMGAHVSAVPNHQTGRVTPLFTRAAVAMGGTYGYELDLGKLPQEELDQMKALNEKVHALQPILFYGDFYRLRSPYEGDETAWMSVTADKSEAVVTHVFARALPNVKPFLLKLQGLDPEKDYLDTDSGRVYGGDELMLYGIALDVPAGDYAAQQFHLKAVK